MKIQVLEIVEVGLLAVLSAGSVAVGAPAPPAERPKEVASFQAHQYVVETLVFSPDGKVLVSGGSDGKIKLWEAASGKNIVNIRAHLANEKHRRVAGVLNLAFSPDGKTLASCGDGIVELWDAASGSNKDKLEAGGSRTLLYSPDGKTLLCSLGMLDLKTKEPQRLKGQLKGDMHTVTFAPNGEVFYATISGWSGPTGIWLWEMKGGKIKKAATCTGHSQPPMCMAFNSDAKVLASAGHDQTVRLWDVVTGKNTATFDKLPRRSSCLLKFSPRGGTLALTYKGEHDSIRVPGTILLLEVPTGKILATLKGHKEVITSIAFSPNGQMLASGGGDGIVKIWRLPKRYATDEGGEKREDRK